MFSLLPPISGWLLCDPAVRSLLIPTPLLYSAPPCRPYSQSMSNFLALPDSWVSLPLPVLSPSTLSAAGGCLHDNKKKLDIVIAGR